jgi:hypothetical protein
MTQDGSGVKFDHFIGSYYIIVSSLAGTSFLLLLLLLKTTSPAHFLLHETK